jgi:hypothetical protein
MRSKNLKLNRNPRHIPVPPLKLDMTHTSGLSDRRGLPAENSGLTKRSVNTDLLIWNLKEPAQER